MRNIHKRSKRNLLVGFGFSLLILILSSGLSYLSIRQLLESQKMVKHTTEVEKTLERLVSRMKDAETGQRGFLLTGEEAFLSPYIGAKGEVFDLLNASQSLTADNQDQQSDLPILEHLIDKKFKMMNESIAKKKRGIPASATLLASGKLVMDSLRTVIHNMVSRENKLLITRNASMKRFAASTPILIGLAALISMVITIIFYFRVRKDAQRATDLQKELVEQEKKKTGQITAIGEIAQQIAKGDYTARIDRKDLE